MVPCALAPEEGCVKNVKGLSPLQSRKLWPGGLLPIYVNKVLLERSHVYLLFVVAFML